MGNVLQLKEDNPVFATVANGIDFLFTKYEKGLSNSALNTIRSALSTVIFPPNQSFVTRAATTSAAYTTNLPIDIIMKAAGCSNATTAPFTRQTF